MYQRENRTVTLTMTVEEYEVFLTAVGHATAYALREKDRRLVKTYLEFMNSVNAGHPRFIPFKVPE